MMYESQCGSDKCGMMLAGSGFKEESSMNTKKKCVAFIGAIVLLGLSTTAPVAYATSGAGLMTCGDFLSKRDEAPSTEARAIYDNAVASWLVGYLAGLNFLFIQAENHDSATDLSDGVYLPHALVVLESAILSGIFLASANYWIHCRITRLYPPKRGKA